MAKCRIGTAKFFTLLLLLYRTLANAPGDKYGPSKTRSSKPTVIEQIKGITEVKQPSKEINAFGWGFNKRKGGTKFDSDAYAASNSAGP